MTYESMQHFAVDAYLKFPGQPGSRIRLSVVSCLSFRRAIRRVRRFRRRPVRVYEA